MRPGPALAVQAITAVIDISGGPRPAKEALAELALLRGWCKASTEAVELGEKWEIAFLKRLRDEVNRCRDEGHPFFVTVNSSSPYLIQGAAFIEPHDPPNIQESKRRRANSGAYLMTLRALSPRDFEALCVGVLAQLGVADYKLTKASADEGIDFFGRLRLADFLDADPAFPGIEQQLSVWMVGQAKHYQETSVSTPDVRELVGSVELAKAKVFGAAASVNHYSTLSIRPCDPIFYLFLTTGVLTRNTQLLLKGSGVIGMHGEMIAQFLSSHDIGTSAGMFDPPAFSLWLSKFVT